MTKPTQAVNAPRGGMRLYRWPPQPPHELEVPSVTAVISNGIPKPALVGWAAKKTAEAAVDDHEIVGAMLKKGDQQAAIDYLKGARFRDTTKKANRGTIVHAAVEAYLAGHLTTEDEIEASLDEARVPRAMWRSAKLMVGAALNFLDEREPEVLHSEATVYSREHGYAGTADLIVTMRVGQSRRNVVVDFKTSPRIYDETSLQLCAYARADFVGLDDGTELTIPEDIEHGVAVRLAPGGKYEAVTFSLTDDLFDVFLGARTVALGQNIIATSRRPGN